MDTPTAIDAAANASLTDLETSLSAIAALPGVVSDIDRSMSSVSLRFSPPAALISGTQRCVLLCRFRL
jgi:hypothetical protein